MILALRILYFEDLSVGMTDFPLSQETAGNRRNQQEACK
jgi:hypothetical protein